jgi:hypothetical protein
MPSIELPEPTGEKCPYCGSDLVDPKSGWVHECGTPTEKHRIAG